MVALQRVDQTEGHERASLVGTGAGLPVEGCGLIERLERGRVVAGPKPGDAFGGQRVGLCFG